MKRITITQSLFIGVILVSLLLSSCNNKKQKETKKPNIIVLLVDDAGYADFGFAGCKDLKTPNIDKLASNGVVFTDAHVSASVCGPSRAGLITGRYQQRFGFECNPNGHEGIDLKEKTIGDAMKSAGYTTAAFGKWHLGGEEGYQPNDRGFDYYWGFLSGGRHYFSNDKQDVAGHSHSIRENKEHATFEGYLTDALGQKAVDFIGKNKENPFFIYWAPNAVHTPMEATKEDLALFEDHPRQTLAAMTWALDRAVGMITDKLKQEGLLENTLIFFLSDNGGAHNNQSSNKPLKGFKGNKFEGGHRVPFFVSWANQFNKQKFNGLSSSLDIFATCLDVAGIPDYNRERYTDGVSLIPFLKGEKVGNPHNELYWRKDQMAAARLNNNKLIRVQGLGYRMYDLEKNLEETDDLQYKEPEKLKDIRLKLENWETELMKPLWTEGAAWDTVTKIIHKDYYNNVEPRAKSPWALNEWLKKNGGKLE